VSWEDGFLFSWVLFTCTDIVGEQKDYKESIIWSAVTSTNFFFRKLRYDIYYEGVKPSSYCNANRTSFLPQLIYHIRLWSLVCFYFLFVFYLFIFARYLSPLLLLGPCLRHEWTFAGIKKEPATCNPRCRFIHAVNSQVNKNNLTGFWQAECSLFLTFEFCLFDRQGQDTVPSKISQPYGTYMTADVRTNICHRRRRTNNRKFHYDKYDKENEMVVLRPKRAIDYTFSPACIGNHIEVAWLLRFEIGRNSKIAESILTHFWVIQ
jgi:hypothetical protein